MLLVQKNSSLRLPATLIILFWNDSGRSAGSEGGQNRVRQVSQNLKEEDQDSAAEENGEFTPAHTPCERRA